jgi:hypothetical protein
MDRIGRTHGEMRMKFRLENRKIRDHLGDVILDGIKMDFFEKGDVKVGTAFNWL